MDFPMQDNQAMMADPAMPMANNADGIAAPGDASLLPPGVQAALDMIAGVEGEEQADGKAPGEDDSHEKLIRQFEQEHKFPEYVKQVYDEIDIVRKYVHTESMVPKTKTAVAENLIIRNQQIRGSQLWAKDPDLVVEPKELMHPEMQEVPQVPPMTDQTGIPMTDEVGNPILDPVMSAQAAEIDAENQQAMGAFIAYKKHLTRFGKTNELLVKHYFDRADGGAIIDGGIQDAQTDGLFWVKLTWQENMGKDPLGVHRANDFQDTVNRLMTLAAEFEAGDFNENDAKFAQYVDLSNTVREQIKGEQWVKQGYGQTQTVDPGTGEVKYQQVDPRELSWNQGERAQCADIAEIPRDRCFRLDPVDPTDIRRDWSITRPEEWRKSRWLEHRLWMTDNEIKDEFGLTEDELKDMFNSSNADAPTESDALSSGSHMQDNPADRESVERSQRAGHRAVWERWDRSSNRRYVWVEGCERFLVNEVPQVVSKYWYPFFLLYFNRVTGRFEPVSDAKMQKPLNEEYNLLRTHDRQGRKAAYNKYIIAKNLMTEEEKLKLESCPPEGVIEVKRANEVKKYLQVVVGSNYKPELYDEGKVTRAMDQAANIPSSARGNTASAKFAASDEIANQVMNGQADRFRGAVEKFGTEIMTAMVDILNQVLPEANAKAIAGPGAVWPMMDRESLWSNLHLSIRAGSSGKPDQQQKMAFYESLAGIMQSMGIGGPTSPDDINGRKILEDLFNVANIRADANDYLVPKPPMPTMPPAGAEDPAMKKPATKSLEPTSRQPPGGASKGPAQSSPARHSGGKVPLPPKPPGDHGQAA